MENVLKMVYGSQKEVKLESQKILLAETTKVKEFIKRSVRFQHDYIPSFISSYILYFLLLAKSKLQVDHFLYASIF